MLTPGYYRLKRSASTIPTFSGADSGLTAGDLVRYIGTHGQGEYALHVFQMASEEQIGLPEFFAYLFLEHATPLQELARQAE